MADYLDARIEYAREYWRPKEEGNPDWVTNGVNNTIADVALGAADMLRCGSGLGHAIYDSDENGYGRAAFAAMDVSRCAALFATLAGPFAKPSCPIDRFSREPQSLMDQMVLDAAKSGAGKPIIRNLGDRRFKGMDKYSYSETSDAGVLSEVHYVKDPKTGKTMDFKFKHHAQRYPLKPRE